MIRAPFPRQGSFDARREAVARPASRPVQVFIALLVTAWALLFVYHVGRALLAFLMRPPTITVEIPERCRPKPGELATVTVIQSGERLRADCAPFRRAKS